MLAGFVITRSEISLFKADVLRSHIESTSVAEKAVGQALDAYFNKVAQLSQDNADDALYAIQQEIYSRSYFESEEYQREVVKPLLEELHGDEDAYAYSEENGWFYED